MRFEEKVRREVEEFLEFIASRVKRYSDNKQRGSESFTLAMQYEIHKKCRLDSLNTNLKDV